MADDYDDPPESDPYCAHFASIVDDDQGGTEHPPCDACGHSCASHPVLWGSWCNECDGDCCYVSTAAPGHREEESDARERKARPPDKHVVAAHAAAKLRAWDRTG
jgi:hypothetical protein